jgi:hypothetical protein
MKVELVPEGLISEGIVPKDLPLSSNNFPHDCRWPDRKGLRLPIGEPCAEYDDQAGENQKQGPKLRFQKLAHVFPPLS